MAVLVSCLLGNFFDGDTPASSDIPSCSCNSVTLTFRSSLFSTYLSVSLAVSSKPTRRLRHRDSLAFFVPGWEGTVLRHQLFQGPLWPRKNFGHISLALLLPTVLLCCLLSLTLQPSSYACHEVVLSLLCQKSWNISTAISRRVLQDVPLRDLFVFWLHQAMCTFYGHNFQVILHCLHNPSFQRAPSNSLPFQTSCQSFT